MGPQTRGRKGRGSGLHCEYMATDVATRCGYPTRLLVSARLPVSPIHPRIIAVTATRYPPNNGGAAHDSQSHELLGACLICHL